MFTLVSLLSVDLHKPGKFLFVGGRGVFRHMYGVGRGCSVLSGLLFGGLGFGSLEYAMFFSSWRWRPRIPVPERVPVLVLEQLVEV